MSTLLASKWNPTRKVEYEGVIWFHSLMLGDLSRVEMMSGEIGGASTSRSQMEGIWIG